MSPEFPAGSTASHVVQRLGTYSDPIYVRVEVSSQEEKQIADKTRDVMLRIQEQIRDLALECLQFCRKHKALEHCSLVEYFSDIYNKSVSIIYVMKKTIFSCSRNLPSHSA